MKTSPTHAHIAVYRPGRPVWHDAAGPHPVGTLNATILHIPVIIGVIALGLKPGLILGLAFGLVSTLRAFGIPLPASPLVMTLMDKSPCWSW